MIGKTLAVNGGFDPQECMLKVIDEHRATKKPQREFRESRLTMQPTRRAD